MMEFNTPQGWQMRSEDGSTISLYLPHSRTSMLFACATAAILPRGNNDSRHLLWTTSRFASAWHVPLLQWHAGRGSLGYEALRPLAEKAILVSSGTANAAEFLAVAYIYPPDAVQIVRRGIGDLLRSTRIIKEGTPFLSIAGAMGASSVIAPPVDGRYWFAGGTKIAVPAGWIVSDLVSPGSEEYNAKYVPMTLNIERHDPGTGKRWLMNLSWIAATSRLNPERVHFTKVWQRQVSLVHSGPQGAVYRDELRVGTSSKFILATRAFANPFDRTSRSMQCLYESDRLVVTCSGVLPDESGRAEVMRAVEAIVLQIS